MTHRVRVVILGLVALLAAVAVVGTALAQTPTPTPKQPPNANYMQFFLDRLAANLNVDRQKLADALKQSRNDAIDQATTDGKLTREQADKLKALQGDGLRPFGFKFNVPIPRPDLAPKKPALMLGAAQTLDAIAQALGITTQDLNTQLRSGKTLKDLAQGKEKEVKDAILKVAKAQLDQAVGNGRLTQQQADAAYSKLQNTDLTNFLARGWKPLPEKDGANKNLQPRSKPSQGLMPWGRGAL